MNSKFRTHLAVETAELSINTSITVSGWVHKIRDLGQLLFIDLRDRSGLIQIMCNTSDVLKKAQTCRNEWVIQVSGTIQPREAQNINENLPTGEIELQATSLTVLNTSEVPIFSIFEDQDVDENLRLQYRYLDLRKPKNAAILKKRHLITTAIREYLVKNEYLDIETPLLTKSTPEGARDFLVPSRLHPHHFYALPQSPQLFKQLLMMSGFDRYFQIVKCFRDEDMRADRQPEFTQVDIEAAFVKPEDIMSLTNGLLKTAFEAVGLTIQIDIPIMTYQEAMSQYGTDRPDLRFDLKLQDITHLCLDIPFKIFSSIASKNGLIKGFKVPKGVDHLSRKVCDELGEIVKPLGFPGISWIHFKEDSVSSPIAKFLSPEWIQEVKTLFGAATGDTILLLAHESHKPVHEGLSRLRLHLGEMLNLISTENKLVWITQFPLFDIDSDGQLTSMHHPFTAPHPDHISILKTNPLETDSLAYDIVLNGTELGGGSIRIHDAHLQQQIFELLTLTPTQINDQ
ncbi:MAG: aspartate--tRNA ligase, partial [Candidatus Margulisbacteria bacterium]|nr:aspartate--tRNA ligase [Candidatus Margulisiibacteriota bacterium]